jgi:hypothetical protein
VEKAIVKKAPVMVGDTQLMANVAETMTTFLARLSLGFVVGATGSE